MRSLLWLACALSFGVVVAQSPPIPQDHEAIHREMESLFQAIEVRQHGIDRMLYGASAGEVAVAGVAESGIGELVRKSRDDGAEVLRDIDRILELARSHTHQGGGACQGSCKGLCKSSGSGRGSKPSAASAGSNPAPLAGVKSNGDPRAREGTPRDPAAGTKPSSDGGTPSSPGPDPDELARDRRAGPPPVAKTEYVVKPDSSERWGDLPIQVREVFRTQGGADMPPLYRDWIDGYHRRLLDLK